MMILRFLIIIMIMMTVMIQMKIMKIITIMKMSMALIWSRKNKKKMNKLIKKQ